jgi:UDP-N-acetylglucosamine diphosphorylase / glucose-1-phosphate thymidylyltransferase / UDP-N-acetylgalactosamine diphosphorylase / glucosamine-1-phosphate N-acetyltransferase / galactosamine-1-phosphate N-acetyltransferase
MSARRPTLCIFEDDLHPNFEPLVYSRPVFDLRCGIRTLREKILSHFPATPYSLWCRPNLKGLVEERNPEIPVNVVEAGVTLYVNGRVLMDDSLARTLTLDGPDCVFLNGDTLIAARMQDSRWPILLSGSEAASVVRETMEQIEVPATLIEYSWDLIRLNGDELDRDFQAMNPTPAVPAQMAGSHLINEQQISVAHDAEILPGSVMDASNGPVFVGSAVRILPHCYIQGPASIGAGSTIQAGTSLYGGTSIGAVCKVGGEVVSSIVQGYSNKQHHGFLGHSYVGEWVNIGAGTTNSNLKNTYGSVSIKLGGEMIDTGMTFLGILMGDYAKTAIDTTFSTGSTVGFSSNVVSGGSPVRNVPSFCWYGPEGMTDYQLTKALEVAQRMMTRRDLVMGPIEASRFVSVFGETARDRAHEFDLAK